MIKLVILLEFALHEITDFDINLPACLFPIFKVYPPNDGISKIPLEEFPIIIFEYFNKDKNFLWPKL